MAVATRILGDHVPHVTTLYARYRDGEVQLRCDLALEDESACCVEVLHPLDDTVLADLCGKADVIVRHRGWPGIRSEARRLGEMLWQTMLPEQVRSELRTVRGGLQIDTNLYGVPWELLYDGEHFWGTRYAIGRRLLVERGPGRSSPATGAEEPSRRRALIIGADPRGDLPSVRWEIKALRELFESQPSIDIVEVQHISA